MKSIKKAQAGGSPFDFAKAEVKFKKLDDLPSGKPHTADKVMQAMKVLHKMVHAQAAAYGGKRGKLLPVGIAELSLLKSFSMISEDQDGIEQISDVSVDPVGDELDEAYSVAHDLVDHLGHKNDEEGMKLVLKLITYINRGLELSRDVEDASK